MSELEGFLIPQQRRFNAEECLIDIKNDSVAREKQSPNAPVLVEPA